MGSFLFVVATLGISLIRLQHHSGVTDYWRSQIFLGMAACMCGCAVLLARRVHWMPAVAFLWAALSAVVVSFAPASPYAGFGPNFIASADAYAAQTGLFLLAVAMPIALASQTVISNLLAALRWVILIDSVIVLGQLAWTRSFFWSPGLLGNASMNACFLACAYPLVVGRLRHWTLLVLPLAAIVASGSSMGMGVLGVVLAVSLARYVRLRWLVLTALLVVGVGWITMGKSFLSDSGRIAEWKLAMTWWNLRAETWLGAGSGMFQLIGPNIQVANGQTGGGFFTFLHSDWLQVLFEQGWIGALLVCGLLGLMVAKTWSRPALLSAIAGYAAWAAANMPLRYFLSAAFGALLVRLAFEGDDGKVGFGEGRFGYH